MSAWCMRVRTASKRWRRNKWCGFHAVILGLVLSSTLAPMAALAAQEAVGASQPTADAIVRCEPQAVLGYTDSPVVIDLYVEGVQNLMALDVMVTFTPSVARVVDQDGSTSGTQIASVSTGFKSETISVNSSCNDPVPGDLLCDAAGKIWYSANQKSPTAPYTGSQSFARVTFQPQTVGAFTMSFLWHKLTDENGATIPSIAQSCNVEIQTPLAVDVASFTAQEGPGGVALHWETVSEVRHAGFNVLRADGAEGPWRQVNSVLIPAAAPGSSAGSAYSWEDSSVESGQTYFYILEDVTLEGVRTRHEPIEVTTQAPNAVALSGFAGHPAIGWSPVLLTPLALLFIALRRRRG